jgi:P4 family phage/plasmid primase-like protien
MDRTSLNEYIQLLASSRINKADNSTEITHTLMGSPYGKYHISEQNYGKFVKLYKKVYKYEQQYVVERPNRTSFLFIDIDWHHKKGIIERQYTEKHIDAIINEINTILLDTFDIQKYQLTAFSHEKDKPTHDKQKNTYKDGFHIFYPDIPLSFEHRYFVIQKLSQICELKKMFRGIEYSNDYKTIFDKSIVTANGILMYGSAKQGSTPYKVTRVYDYKGNSRKISEDEYSNDELINLMLNRRYEDRDQCLLRSDLTDDDFNDIEQRYRSCLSDKDANLLGLNKNRKTDIYNSDNEDDSDNNSGSDNMYNNKNSKTKSKHTKKYDSSSESFDTDSCETTQDSESMEASNENKKNTKNKKNNNSEKIFSKGDHTYAYDSEEDDGYDEDTKAKKHRKLVVDKTAYVANQNDIFAVKRLTSILSRDRATGHDDWINVGFALHNVSPSLYSTFVKFSQKTKADNFDINACRNVWKTAKKNRYTVAAFYRWARDDNKDHPSVFEKVLRDIINPEVERATSGTHSDVASLVHTMYRDQYKCVSITNDAWFEFQDSKWVPVESAYTLTEKITTEVFSELLRFTSIIAKQTRKGGIEGDDFINKIGKVKHIAKQLKSLGFVNAVKSFCARKFYDPKFEEKLNDNYDLIGFENGVFDLSTMTFRKGLPDDYITFSVGYDYVVYKEDDKIFIEIYDYFKKVQRDPAMMNYLLEFIASCMRGMPDQHFHFWTGSGSNGKSTTIDMIKQLMGDYFGVLPITILTRKRGSSSGPTPELADKNGKRLLVLQEPEHTDVIYVGQMKELTGTDTIYARGMYEKKGFEYVPQFKMVMPCNILPPIPARDGGTWRRIRATPWESEFVDDEPVEDHQFKKDKKLTQKFAKWKEPLMWLILNKYFKKYKENDYDIYEPDKIKEATKDYKKDSDIYYEFILQYMVELDPKDREYGIHSEALNDIYDTFKKWYRDCYAENPPNRKELIKYFREHRKKWTMDQNNIHNVRLNTT